MTIKFLRIYLRKMLLSIFSSSEDKNLAKLATSIDSSGLSYLGKEALYDLGVTMKHLNDETVPGDVIECGCALGGSAIILASTKGRRHLSLFDVFGLIPPPSDRDDSKVHQRYEIIASGRSEGLRGEPYYGYEQDLLAKVKNNFESLGYPCEQNEVRFIQGLYEDTLHYSAPVALFHIDCDWYDSVATCLNRISPHISPGGRIVIDDYYYYSGCKAAVDEFIEKERHNFFVEHRTRLHLVRHKNT